MRKFLFFLLALFVSCSLNPPAPPHPWADSLRALDLADASTPANDITAVYLREREGALQIRVDFLDFDNLNDLSVEIRIADPAAPQAVPLTIHLPSQTDVARISPDPLLATVTLEIPGSSIPPNPHIDISTPEDEFSDLTLDGPIPSQTTPLLLAFYDTFAGRFPAEALRSWNGAHTGPRGERHGLKHLLDAVEEHQISIFALDLDAPENLSALDAMGVLPKIEALQGQGLLSVSGNEDVQFAHLEDSSHLYRSFFSNDIYVPLPTETEETQPVSDGPTLELRRALLNIALNDDEREILAIGGSFANSTWGSPDMVEASLAYFASRPYIQILNEEIIKDFPTISQNAIVPQEAAPTDEMSAKIQATLDFANSWAENSPPLPEIQYNPSLRAYLLSNETSLAVFEPQGGYMSFLFTRENREAHQFIGPAWQVAPGLEFYPGAFADDREYQPILAERSLTFRSSDGTLDKIFTILDIGLQVEYLTADAVTAQIPLLVSPDARFSADWAQGYTSEISSNEIRWGLVEGPMIGIQFDGGMGIHAFNEDLSLLRTPEDPDFQYPIGHYLPFPMAVVEVEMRGGYLLRLGRLP